MIIVFRARNWHNIVTIIVHKKNNKKRGIRSGIIYKCYEWVKLHCLVYGAGYSLSGCGIMVLDPDALSAGPHV